MKLPPFLTEWPYGEIVVKGHRINLYQVVFYHKQGQSALQLHEQYPTLPVKLLEDILVFYESNRAEVDDYIQRYQEELERQYAADKHIDWAELQRRREARKRTTAG